MYGQVALPLITSSLIAGVSEASVLLTGAVVAGFLTHEPLLVLLGRRGARTKVRAHTEALVCFAIGSALTVATGLLAIWWAAPDVRWAFFLPSLPATYALAAAAVGREKTLSGEVAAALTFALAAAPLALAAGAALDDALAVAGAFAVVFTAGTLAVRAVIVGVRRGGNARALRATQGAALVQSVVVIATLSLAAVRGQLPPAPLFAIVPALLVTSAITARPPAPARLRATGWTLVASMTVTASVLVAML